jgi:lipopolysaccharide biosynthesis glycosyltransferase
MSNSIFIGYDSNEVEAFVVAVKSIRRYLTHDIPIYGLQLDELQRSGLYYRPTHTRYTAEGVRVIVDELSMRSDYNGAVSTEFAISRFLTPLLASTDLALFMDCDVLVRCDINNLFAAADRDKAVMVVKHKHKPTSGEKMGGQLQTSYHRKNWSSVMLFNCRHPATGRLNLEMINTLPGRDLHALCWLEDEEIGSLDPRWNWLAGEQEPIDDPLIVHHTLGSPCLPGFYHAPYAEEWREVLKQYAVAP